MARFMFYDDKIINILMRDEKPSGGAAVQAYGWIRGLSEEGHDIQIFTSNSHDAVLKEECYGLHIIPLYDNLKGIRWLRWLYYRLPYIYQKIKQHKPDYLYQGVPGWASFLIGLICYQLGIKYILRISNDYLLDERFYKKYSRTHRFFQRLGFRLSHCILCQNEYQLSIIQKEFPAKKAIKISNPFCIRSVETPASIKDRKYIAWLGLYQYQKNLKLLYEIASRLKDELFLVAGKELPDCDEDTRHYLNKLKQLPNVRFVGFLPRHEVLPFLAKAKFLLNTSHYEGFSNTFLEAMSVGTPILSSHKVNPDNIIPQHQLGIIYEDEADLQQQYLALSADTYYRMSDNALNYVLEHHDHKALAKKLLEVLNVHQPGEQTLQEQSVA